MDNNNLQHAGIKGMRWGVRRYQNKDGSLTPAGRKRYGSRFDKEDDDIDEEEVKKRYEEGKQKALKSGSIEEVLKYKGDLTNKELGEVYSRLKYEKDIESLKPKAKDGVDKFSDLMGKVDTVRAGADKAVSAYNLIAKVNNTFNKHQMPTIDGVNRALEATRKASEAAETAAKLKKAYDAAKSGDSKRMDDAFADLSSEEMNQVKTKIETDSTLRGKYKSPSAERAQIQKDVAKEIRIKEKVSEINAARKRGDKEAIDEILNTMSYDEIADIADLIKLQNSVKTGQGQGRNGGKKNN